MTEDKIQMYIVSFLETTLPKGAVVFHVPNGSGVMGGARKGAKLKAMGLKSGVPDLVVLAQNKAVFIEVKNEKGRLAQSQKDFAESAKALGFDWFLARSIDDVRAGMRDCGIKLREAT